MPKELLSVADIKGLIRALRSVFGYITKFKSKYLLAKKIKYPQIPGILAESLAMHLLTDGTILPELIGSTFMFGGQIADILAQRNGNTLKIEIKSTGHSAFQQLGEKDICADYLIWFHFDTFFMEPNSTSIEIYLLRAPEKYLKSFKKPIKKKLTSLKKLVGPAMEMTTFDVSVLS